MMTTDLYLQDHISKNAYRTALLSSAAKEAAHSAEISAAALYNSADMLAVSAATYAQKHPSNKRAAEYANAAARVAGEALSAHQCAIFTSASIAQTIAQLESAPRLDQVIAR